MMCEREYKKKKKRSWWKKIKIERDREREIQIRAFFRALVAPLWARGCASATN